jgi:lipoprotein-anchoring transpeptidase ErfK/SrfK
MLRFVIGLLAVVSVYLGWEWYADKSSHARGERPAHSLFQNAPDEKPGDPGVDPAAGPVAEQPASPASPAAAKGDGLVAGILSGDAGSLKTGFQALAAAEEPRRGELAQALARASNATENLDAQLAVLGASNAFLHTEQGRKLARKLLVKIHRLDRERAIVKSTVLLEQCMRGPIAKNQEAAYELVNEIYRGHKRLVEQVTFNPSRLTKARSHKVKLGETLDGIARKYRKQKIRVEGWTLCYMNRIGRPNRLQAGKTIKIPVEPIWVKLEKESFLMAVYLGDTIIRLYWVAHGKDGCGTPETTFHVADKLSNPDWYAPDGNTYAFGHPKNVLGRYFVKFAHDSFSGFGAHGTADPSTIRTRASLGCIRMHDADIEEFFRLVPARSRIVIASTK